MCGLDYVRTEWLAEPRVSQVNNHHQLAQAETNDYQHVQEPELFDWLHSGSF